MEIHLSEKKPFLRIYGIAVLTLCLTTAPESQASDSATSIPSPYIKCAAPLYATEDSPERHGQNGYGIEVKGERYFFIYDERSIFALLDADKGTGVAHLKVDHSPSNFSEQAQWRERWLQDIAERSHVPLLRNATGKVTILTANKKELTGKSAGLSVLIDAPRKTFVQWEWDISDTYTGPQDVLALQGATWKHLVPCLEK